MTSEKVRIKNGPPVMTYSKRTLRDLARSGLSADHANVMQLEEISDQQMRKAVGKNCSGYKIPYFDVEGNPTGFHRIRFHKPQPDKDGKPQKYSQPSKTGVHLYVPPNFDFGDILCD